MKMLFTLTLLIPALLLHSQELYQGNITDHKTGMPLSYVNIGVVGKDIGTVSDMDGNFKSGILSVDLREYNIVMQDDFFVALEWIEDLG